MAGRKLTAKDLKVFKKILEEEESRLQSEFKHIQRERQALQQESIQSQDRGGGDEASDAAQEAAEFSRISAIETHILQMLKKVEVAKQKIKEKAYGICEGCEQPIEKPRLRAIPFALFCIRCQRQSERGRK